MSRHPSTTIQEQPRIVDAREAARILGRSYYDIRRWALAGELKLVRFPSTEPHKGKGRRSEKPRPIRRLLFDRADVEQFIERCKRSA